MRLTKKTIADGDTLTWPEGDNLNSKGDQLSLLVNHRLDFSGAGTPTVQYRLTPGGVLKTLTPPTDWTTSETLQLGGIHQFVIAAAGGEVVADIFSFNEGK